MLLSESTISILHTPDYSQQLDLNTLTEADLETVRPRKMMKKKGPHRSQSLSALPRSSRSVKGWRTARTGTERRWNWGLGT